jgi:hypothetical protein
MRITPQSDERKTEMNRLTKLIAPAVIASLALGATAPVAAAPFYGAGAGNIRQQIAQLDRKVEQAERRHLITRQEAQRLDRLVNQVQNLHTTFARNGLSRAELRALDQRIDTVERQIDREIADRDGRRGGPQQGSWGHGDRDHDGHGR